MVLSSRYELVELVDETIAIPVGEFAKSNKNVLLFSKAAAYLIQKMKNPITKQEMVEVIIAKYEIDRGEASRDVDNFIDDLFRYRIIE